jgi:hypothetical protein
MEPEQLLRYVLVGLGILVLAYGSLTGLFREQSTKSTTGGEIRWDRTLVLGIVCPLLALIPGIGFVSVLLLPAVAWSLFQRRAARRLSKKVVASLPDEPARDAGRIATGATDDATENFTAEAEPEPSIDAPAKPGAIDRSEVRLEEYDTRRRTKKSDVGDAIRRRGHDSYVEAVRIMQQGSVTLVLGLLAMAVSLDIAMIVSAEVTLSSLFPTIGLVIILVMLRIQDPRRVTSVKLLRFWRNVEAVLALAAAFLAGLVVIEVLSDPTGFGAVDWVLVTIGVATTITFVAMRVRNGRRIRERMMCEEPLRLSVLWAFESAPEHLKLGMQQMIYWLRDDWQFVGGAQFLRGPGFLISEVTDLIRPSARRVVTTEKEIDAAFGNPLIPVRSGLTDSWLSFPAQSVLCHDAVWRRALDLMLTNADVILMDLRGFSRENQGCVQEIHSMFSRVPVDRIVFVADESVDRRLLRATLGNAWARMSEASPNQGVSGAKITVQYLDAEELAAQEKRSILARVPMFLFFSVYWVFFLVLRYLLRLGSPDIGKNRRLIMRDTWQARSLNILLCEAAAAARPDARWDPVETIPLLFSKVGAVLAIAASALATLALAHFANPPI